MIIDAHIHLYRPEMQPGANPNYLADMTDTYKSYGAYLRLCFTPTKYNHTRQGWVTCDRMVEIMDAEGIDMVAVVGPEDEYLAKVHRQYPDRIIPFMRVSMPDLRNNLREELAKMRHYILNEGFFGFGEFHPDINGYNLYTQEIIAVMELAQELNVPVNIHASEPVGHFYYGKSQNPFEEYYWLAKRYPDLKLILAHWGGGLCFYESIPYVRETLKNVYYDTTASKLFFDTTKSLETISKIVNPRKIFYGSDYPLLLHPELHPDELNPRFLWDRSDFLSAEISSHILDGIMGDNFAEFMKIQKKQGRSSLSKPLMNDRIKFVINPDSSVFEIIRRYPETSIIFDKFGIPCKDIRVPPWMGLIQSLAQMNIWYEDGFISELREGIPLNDPLQRLEDLDLIHENTRLLANKFPKVKSLMQSYGIPCVDSPLPPWKTIAQAVAEKNLTNINEIVAELKFAAGGYQS